MTTLSTEHLSLRPLVKARPYYVHWLTDPDVVRYSEQRHKQHTITTCQKYIDSFQGGSRIWAIHLISSNKHIGNITSMLDVPNNVAEVGILIGEKTAWRHGYGLEAWNAVTRWLLDKDGGAVRKLEGGCAALNTGMRRMFEKSGFTFEGERLGRFIMGGTLCGALMYGRFR